MKKITLMLLAFFAFTYHVTSQCIGTFEYVTVVSNNLGTVQIIDGCNWSGDWNNITGLLVGSDYEFSSDNPTDYLTFTDDSNNVIASGVTPLSVPAVTVTSGRIHVYYDSSCTGDSVCRETYIQCTSCVPAPAPPNDDCTAVTPAVLTNGTSVTFTGTTLGATMNAAETSVLGTPTVWEAVTLSGACNNLTIDYCGTPAGNMTGNMWIVYTDCLTEFTIGDYDFTTCPDGNGTLSFINLPAGTYYLPVISDSTYNTLGDYTMNVISVDCPVAPDCASTPFPVDGATDIPFGTTTFTWSAPVTGPTPTSYNIYSYDDAVGTNPVFLGTVTTESADFILEVYETTIFWAAIPVNGTTEATGCAIWSFTTEDIPPAPINDGACNAILIPIGTETSGGAYYNVSATLETSEVGGSCYFLGDPASESVWFSFVAPASGEVLITTEYFDGTLQDTQITLYQISDCANLATAVEIDCDEDDDDDVVGDGSGLEANLQVSGLTSGATYYFVVDGYGTSVGTFDVGVLDPTLSVHDFDTQNLFTYYPNPVSNTLTLNAQRNIQSVSVMNMLGQEVLRATPNTLNSVLDMSNLTSGSYFVNVMVEGVSETVRIVKQ